MTGLLARTARGAPFPSLTPCAYVAAELPEKKALLLNFNININEKIYTTLDLLVRQITLIGSMTPDLIIFDCDGVLVDSEIIACRVDARELGRLGFRLTVDDVAARFVGRSTKDMLDTLEAEQGIPVPAGFREHILASVLTAFDSELAAVPNMARALAAIEAPVCVASSSDVARIEHSLALTGLLSFFAPNIFSAQMVERGKPSPDLFQLAARSLETPPDACLVVEDSVTGVQAGVAAGMTVVGFCGASHCLDGHAERLSAAGASQVFDDMAALPGLISGLGTEG